MKKISFFNLFSFEHARDFFISEKFSRFFFVPDFVVVVVFWSRSFSLSHWLSVSLIGLLDFVFPVLGMMFFGGDGSDNHHHMDDMMMMIGCKWAGNDDTTTTTTTKNYHSKTLMTSETKKMEYSLIFRFWVQKKNCKNFSKFVFFWSVSPITKQTSISMMMMTTIYTQSSSSSSKEFSVWRKKKILCENNQKQKSIN